ncbi:MAG: hydantoinase/oxoprolinase family protein [Pseudomonadota bacterium]
MRIGIDVGGTHTDAVILNGDDVLAATKQLTTADVVSGVEAALDAVLADGGVRREQIQTVMIGTTQFTNAVVERRALSPVAAVRVGLPSGRGLPPMVDWPDDIREAVSGSVHQIRGGFLYDGNPIADLDHDAVNAFIEHLLQSDINNIAVASAFSPMNASPEEELSARILAAKPDAKITLSRNFGRLGLMERENAAILNAALAPLADKVVSSFLKALESRELRCPVYISQNDGTLMSAEFVKAYPALTFASGPTNSLRGASKLTGLQDAIVVDIGGTTSDIGVLQDGFPRESNSVIEVGGVRTNFRMPDILAVGLGGGSIVSHDGQSIGPKSVGHRLISDAKIFGGDTLTATDIIVARGQTGIGDTSKVANLSIEMLEAATNTIHRILDQNIEMMKPGGKSMPVILVGGGAVLVTGSLTAASQLYRPENAGVANAIGAAIAQVGGEAERLVSYKSSSREDALADITTEATTRAVAAGANIDTIRTVDIEETAIPYMDDSSTRVRVKVIGDLRVDPG